MHTMLEQDTFIEWRMRDDKISLRIIRFAGPGVCCNLLILLCHIFDFLRHFVSANTVMGYVWLYSSQLYTSLPSGGSPNDEYTLISQGGLWDTIFQCIRSALFPGCLEEVLRNMPIGTTIATEKTVRIH